MSDETKLQEHFKKVSGLRGDIEKSRGESMRVSEVYQRKGIYEIAAAQREDAMLLKLVVRGVALHQELCEVIIAQGREITALQKRLDDVEGGRVVKLRGKDKTGPKDKISGGGK